LGHFICGYKVYGEKEIETLQNLSNKLTYVHIHDNNTKKNNHEPLHRPETIEILKKLENWTKPLYSFEIKYTENGLSNSINIVKKIIENIIIENIK